MDQYHIDIRDLEEIEYGRYLFWRLGNKKLFRYELLLTGRIPNKDNFLDDFIDIFNDNKNFLMKNKFVLECLLNIDTSIIPFPEYFEREKQKILYVKSQGVDFDKFTTVPITNIIQYYNWYTHDVVVWLIEELKINPNTPSRPTYSTKSNTPLNECVNSFITHRDYSTKKVETIKYLLEKGAVIDKKSRDIVNCFADVDPTLKNIFDLYDSTLEIKEPCLD